MNPFAKMAAVSACLLVCSSITNAGIIVDIGNAIEGTSQDFKSSKNHIIGKKDGYFGANLFTDSAEITTLTAEFLGSQAKWDIWFTLSNSNDSLTIINHPGKASGVVKANNSNRQQGSLTVGADQLLNLSFFIDDKWKGKSYDWVVKNGENGLPSSQDPQAGGAYFWTGFEYNQAGDISAILLGLDDGGAAYDEDNDDLVIRLSGFGTASLVSGNLPDPPASTPVPVPAALWMMLSGMGLLGAIKRRR